jgi:hypothetical protein
MTSSPSDHGHLHAGDDGFLADVQVAKSADQAHAVKLARFFLEPSDQQHGPVSGQQLVAVDVRAIRPSRMLSLVVCRRLSRVSWFRPLAPLL